MSLSSNYTSTHLSTSIMSLSSNYTSTHCQKLPFSPRKPFQAHEFRVYRRRRLKAKRKFAVRNLFEPTPFENFFQSLITQYPSVNSLDLVTPALGFASGVALYLSRYKSRKNSGVLDIGEWILFASPTPFNRFVLLRCPSISFHGSELLEDVNEKLVKNERHYLTFNSGRIYVRNHDSGNLEDEKLIYQRVCVTTKDGGVVSLDWPANLDLEEERGLDSTLLLVPGTPEGSIDKNIRSFVLEALKRGFFPVVMNPRGCAGSPLTTARLFTAADSDDICTAITYINTARPWTTLMGVGWGYGANMLTKYLAEVGERTPLTAATCIDNPFDLEEATRSSPYHIAIDQKLTGGLIDILRTNKELFQGKTKGFDVERALLAKSVRDFEHAISTVSYGFGSVEDFYSKSSSRNLIGNVKIPVLFIQSDDGTVPTFSVPRDLIAENPFTSLLLCSCLPSSITDTNNSAMSWCQVLTIEWLTGVELGLLKGRHPLLTDVDVTINPSKGFAVVEDIKSNKASKVGTLLDLALSDSFNGYSVDAAEGLLEERKSDAKFSSWSQQELQRNFELGDTTLQGDNGSLQQNTSTDNEIKGENVGSADSEQGQVLQTAQVVMNMLDVTMPGTLTEEKKKKVLTAVGQGETLMNALQNAVPEDVRGKLTAAVTGILQAQGNNLKFDRVLKNARAPGASSGPKSKDKDRLSSAEGLSEDQSPLNQMKRTESAVDDTDNAPINIGAPAGRTESEVPPLEKLQNSSNSVQAQATNNDEVGSSGSFKEESCYSRSNNDTNEQVNEKIAPDIDYWERGLETDAKSGSPNQPEGAGGSEAASVQERIAPDIDYRERGLETDAKSGSPSQPERAGGSEAASVHERKGQNSGIAQIDTEQENNIQKGEEKSQDSSGDQNKMMSTTTKDEPPTETQTTRMEDNHNEKTEKKNMQHTSDQTIPTTSGSSPPSFSVSQALDALTGIDDSTQVAVNSVFGVIENMISQLEENSDNEVKEEKHIKQDVGKKTKGDSQSQENKFGDPSAGGDNDDINLQNDASYTGKQLTQSLGTINEKSVSKSQGINSADQVVQKESKMNGELVAKRSPVDKLDGHSHISRIPLYIVASSYKDPIYGEYRHRYLISKIPTKSLDLDATTALLLGYFPEDGQWKIQEQPQTMGSSSANIASFEGAGTKMEALSAAKPINADKYIEPPYVILDTGKQAEPAEDYVIADATNTNIDINDGRTEQLMQFAKKIVLDSLRMEAGRKLNEAEMNDMKLKLAEDLEHVANAVSLLVGHGKVQLLHTESQFNNVKSAIEKAGTIYGEDVIRAITSSVQETSYLRRMMPLGVILGSSLAALRKHFNVISVPDNDPGVVTHDDEERFVTHDNEETSGNMVYVNAGVSEMDQVPDQKSSLDHPIKKEEVNSESEGLNRNTVMVGAVTAALGASALLMQQQDPYKGNETAESSSPSLRRKDIHQRKSEKLEELISEKNQNNFVTSLTEKAMSVAGPVVPTKEDGGVDQEKLVAMLADLGQRGGLLRSIGKIALLWGGIRGAMSLTDRLISFLHVADRPLYQRIFGFVGMVLVLWSPVAVPLLPTLVQSWTTHTSSRVAELACIIGLYTAVMILVMLWGKRIRGYENPLEQYGLDWTSLPKIQVRDFFLGLAGGVMLIFSINVVNVSLGGASFSKPIIPPSLDVMTWLKVYGQMIIMVVQAIMMAAAITLVEELLFRSWLPQEIAVDLGYHQGIIISGLAFSLFQRSLGAIPGLWLLSLALSGARQRNGGSLSIPIGLRTGMMASSFILQKGRFLTYNGNFPWYITGTHPFEPFSGIVGLVFSLSLAILLYPRHASKEELVQE